MAPPSLAGIARPTMIGSNLCSSERARRVLQDIFLEGDHDPPSRAGGESDVLIGIEPANRAHQSQLALAGHIATRQATAWWVTVALQEYVLKHPARASDEHKLEPLIVGWGRRRPATGGAIGSMSGIAA